MVASAVLGAATGTGLALVVAMTLVVYRYYSSRRWSKDWGDVERFGSWTTVNGRRVPSKISVSSQKVFNVVKEETAVQPSGSPRESVAPTLEVTGSRLEPTLCATPSETRCGRNPSPDGRVRPVSPLILPSDLTVCTPREVPSSPLPLGTLQPSLYTRPVGPLYVTSSNSAGRLHLKAHYDFDKSDLHVHLIEGEKLLGGEISEPYIRLYLDPPVDSRVRQCATTKSTTVLDQRYKFPVPLSELTEHTLVIQVFDYDRYSRNDVIGELRLNLSEVDTTSSVEIWADVDKLKKPREELQEILVSLSYLPSAERLTVCLLKAKNLYLPENKDTIDPLVKVCLLLNGKRVKKRKTTPRKSTSNPVWNEAVTFNIGPSNLSVSAIEVAVVDGDAVLGVVVIGPTSDDTTAISHWEQMSSNPRKAVAVWHHLR